jgi:hypothetical protein
MKQVSYLKMLLSVSWSEVGHWSRWILRVKSQMSRNSAHIMKRKRTSVSTFYHLQILKETRHETSRLALNVQSRLTPVFISKHSIQPRNRSPITSLRSMCFVCVFSPTTAYNKAVCRQNKCLARWTNFVIRVQGWWKSWNPRRFFMRNKPATTKTGNVPIQPGSTVTQIIYKHICIHYTAHIFGLPPVFLSLVAFFLFLRLSSSLFFPSLFFLWGGTYAPVTSLLQVP